MRGLRWGGGGVGPHVTQLKFQGTTTAPLVEDGREGNIQHAALGQRFRHGVGLLKGDGFQRGVLLFDAKAGVLSFMAEASNG